MDMAEELEVPDCEIKEQVWHTATGETIPFSQVTHQHWSNIYWYHRYILESVGEETSTYSHKDFVRDILSKQAQHANKMMEVADEQIKKRFDGCILDWVPIYQNEKLWYKKQSTRKVLIEKFKC